MPNLAIGFFMGAILSLYAIASINAPLHGLADGHGVGVGGGGGPASLLSASSGGKPAASSSSSSQRPLEEEQDPPFHVVFSTSCSAFQDWQSLLVFLTADLVGQKVGEPPSLTTTLPPHHARTHTGRE